MDIFDFNFVLNPRLSIIINLKCILYKNYDCINNNNQNWQIQLFTKDILDIVIVLIII